MAYEIIDIKEETLDSTTSLSKDEVKVETVQLPTVNVPEYSYGASQDSIDGAVGVRNIAPTISTDAYSASWDGDTTTIPSKNAIYDKIQSVVTTSNSDLFLLMGA